MVFPIDEALFDALPAHLRNALGARTDVVLAPVDEPSV